MESVGPGDSGPLHNGAVLFPVQLGAPVAPIVPGWGLRAFPPSAGDARTGRSAVCRRATFGGQTGKERPDPGALAPAGERKTARPAHAAFPGTIERGWYRPGLVDAVTWSARWRQVQADGG